MKNKNGFKVQKVPGKVTPHKPQRTQSLERAISLLKTFDINQNEVALSELAMRTGLNKSTAHRLLTTLEENGLVKQNPQTGKYSLGGEILRLGEVFLQHLNVREVAQPLMYALAQSTSETVALAVRDNNAVLEIMQIPAQQTIRAVSWVGRLVPLHATALGKVLLEDLPFEEIARILPEPLTRFTLKTIVDLPTLLKDLDRNRRQGYAINMEEKELGENAVASPIRDFSGRCVAALGVFGPSFRLSPENLHEVGKLVRDAANEISKLLGWREENPDLLRGATPIIDTASALRETAQ